MAGLRIVLEPERDGLGMAPSDGCELIHIADGADVVVSCLPDGMAEGPDGKKRASVALAFKLPDGDMVIYEASWRLFAFAYATLLGRLGEPDLVGMRLEIPDENRTVEFVASEEPFVQCGSCGWRLDGKNTKESVGHLVREYERHYRKKHRGIPPPPPFPEHN